MTDSQGLVAADFGNYGGLSSVGQAPGDGNIPNHRRTCGAGGIGQSASRRSTAGRTNANLDKGRRLLGRFISRISTAGKLSGPSCLVSPVKRRPRIGASRRSDSRRPRRCVGLKSCRGSRRTWLGDERAGGAHAARRKKQKTNKQKTDAAR